MDPFPDEDIVWGTLCAGAHESLFSEAESSTFPFKSFPKFVDHHVVGIAYTIDPAHEAEVRAYLGTYGRTISGFGVTGRAVTQTRPSARFTRPPRKGTILFHTSCSVPGCPKLTQAVVTIPGRLYPRTCRRLRPHRRAARDGSAARRGMLRRT